MNVRSSCIASSAAGAITTAPAELDDARLPSTTASIMVPTISLPGSPKTARARAVFGEPGSSMVGAMIDAVVVGSLSPDNAAGAVVMAPGPLEAMHELRTFMFERVYMSDTAAGQKHVAIDVIRRLVDHHLAHPELIPATYRDSEADEVTQVVDYVSGMTDRFALNMHDRLFEADASSRMTPLLLHDPPDRTAAR